MDRQEGRSPAFALATSMWPRVMSAGERIVDNRVFMLGLDDLYREAMKHHERDELLECTRRVAATLNVMPAGVFIEGYYAEDKRLTEYFRLVRALQDEDESSKPAVDALPEFQRLVAVMSAPLYGRPQYSGKLLPAGRDALSQALLDMRPNWSVAGLAAASYRAALEDDDFSLVGLAARVQDAVVLAAARESVVLYAEIVLLGKSPPPPRPRYIWKVDAELARQASRFIKTFNALFGERLPAPEPAQAEHYWHAYTANKILGRCVRLGVDNAGRSYHWAICRADAAEFTVQEFWAREIWTTTRYRSALRDGGRCPDL